MDPAFAGPTASHYRLYRRDVPDALLDRLVEHVELTRDAVALDLGAGTGQVAVPLAARVGTVLAVEPEPDMLAQLRQRGEESVRNLLCVLASDREVPGLLDTVGGGRCGLVRPPGDCRLRERRGGPAGASGPDAGRRVRRRGGAGAPLPGGRRR
ncbi:class I SAM-dependent methyltransferase [Modestobacter sp. VKM Ac-2983]|uniref:class I SAM-dependent methyltransferase n=1 Tax=Modestobacter sp. VKM Ac-2983 TaxID=3004137 RepID=UPI003FA5F39A